MDTRREFIKKAAILSGSAGLLSALPPSIQKALAINPAAGSTYLDAEHIVVLMQENRSFDHCYGTLQGVRGFNDPRAISLPDENPVWLQTNAAGETYSPFRLNIKDTKSTWIGSLPHSWTNQVDARNEGKYDKWLDAKPSGHKEFARAPLTMGYYNREDIPFYYSLADAFTVCDQNFCSSLTGTTPNRLYLWTGTIREEQHAGSYANVRNEEVSYGREAGWKTFPERLEENAISWKIYQNEISLDSGFEGEEDSWLANFTNNPIEWFKQYHVRFASGFQNYMKKQLASLPDEIKKLETKVQSVAEGKERDAVNKQLKQKKALLEELTKAQKIWNPETYEKLSQQEKNLHAKAFAINSNDPHYRELTSLEYDDDNTKRTMQIPKGDVLHQFREDVNNSKLPTISWVIAPENFSDHPGAPWYGAWYVSEVMDILTKNPEVWKKTIFILAYDENDGYFDHVPPFVPPHPHKEGTGLLSKGLDAGVEYVTLQQDMKYKAQKDARESSIGLGYRVPLVIASPWSRGGAVCSQVFDHTSILMLMEKFLTHKTGKRIEETNISAWRRAICGDLTSVFKPYNGEKIPLPAFPAKDHFIESINKAQYKKGPSGYKQLTKGEIDQIKQNPAVATLLPKQEKGIRPACAIPYQLQVDGKLNAAKKTFEISFAAHNEIFGKQAAGAPFNVYAPGKYLQTTGQFEPVRTWAYVVVAGDSLTDTWPLSDFENGNYHLRVYGPNGFFREFKGNSQDPLIAITCAHHRKNKNNFSGNIELKITNNSNQIQKIEIKDNGYKTLSQPKTLEIAPGTQASFVADLGKSYGWYDLSVKITGADEFEHRFAGKPETGKAGFTDPLMGNI